MRDPACWIDASGATELTATTSSSWRSNRSYRLVLSVRSRLWNPMEFPQSCMEEIFQYNRSWGVYLPLESVLLEAPNPWILLYSWSISICRSWGSIRILWEDRISCIVSFKIKDTSNGIASTDREPLGPCYLACIYKTIIFSFTGSSTRRSIRTTSSICWMSVEIYICW